MKTHYKNETEQQQELQVPPNGVEYQLIAPGTDSELYPRLPLGWCRVYSSGVENHRFRRREVVRIKSPKSIILRQITYGRNIKREACHLDYDSILELVSDGKAVSGEVARLLSLHAQHCGNDTCCFT